MKDIHAETASKLFNVPLEEVTPEMRAKAKVINYHRIYVDDKGELQRVLQYKKQRLADYAAWIMLVTLIVSCALVAIFMRGR